MNSKGFSLASVILAMALITVMAVVGYDVHIILTRSVVDQEARFTAVNLASSQIEDMKEIAKAALFTDAFFNEGAYLVDNDVATAPAGVTFNLFSEIPENFSVSYVITDKNLWPEGSPAVSYKEITVTCNYPISTGEEAAFSLLGYIVK